MKRAAPFVKTPFLRWLVRIILCLLAFSILLVLLLKWVPVRYTPLMLQRSIEYRADSSFHTQKAWVPLQSFSPALRKAVIRTEDRHFCYHHGFRFDSLLNAATVRRMWQDHRRDGKPLRGFSTISQQTAKNVFTFGAQNVFRKVVEAWWTVLIEVIWGKPRILEVYLNVVETGVGMYGLETAAQVYYGIPASELDLKRSFDLATCLRNPRLLSPLEQPDAAHRELWDLQAVRMQNLHNEQFPDWVEE